jgi:broad specificity phosphatase PhoE
MGTLYLVRHGQASLGADDYDNLSELGQRQSLRLGQYFAARGLQFEAVLMGSLKRHAQTWAGIQSGMASGVATARVPTPSLEPSAVTSLVPSVWPGLNEYDSEAVIASVHPAPHEKPVTPEAYRAHFQLLRLGLRQWASGAVTPRGMPRYSDFVQGIIAALDQVRSQHTGDVLLVSSGGPIGTAVAQLVGASPEAFVELNMRLRNTAVTEFAFNPKRHALLTFNTLPHLDAQPYNAWQTYA